ncbi:hypothetical protein DF141_20650 [Burkholderia cenocepacia]|nr:hypothetical protein CFB44_16370 [Burkholderia sp. AU31280]RQU46987.1 hypothetical protein DF147_12015 [Burkholderia cenocepacia]RQU72237.1 hypothetical protein DF141_20650 [Burkholderia cenocepacia]RQU88083.1 hypothetical protein DF133_18670 [Burkholderia cenocepacia]RQV25994.1 hypothetical protein DF132_10680 [Burkholderia cenocepacia]
MTHVPVANGANGRRKRMPASQPARAAEGGGAAQTSGGATGGGRTDGCAHARGRESNCGRDFARADVSGYIVSECG